MSKIITTWFGVFLVERGKVKDKILFPKNPDQIAKRLKSISEDKILEEELKLSKGIKELKVSEERLSELGAVSKSIKDRDIATMPEVHGFSKSMLQEATLLLGRSRMKEVAEDRFIIQAVKAIDDLNKTANLLSERLHEWYSLHYPELGRELPDEKYASLIARFSSREKVAEEANRADAASSIGAPLTNDDQGAIESYADALDRIYTTRKDLERYIEARMREVAPNITHLTGPILGARLISLAGGLERLARLPSSTIQMLGAEKAFFKHLTEGEDMPKHGVIFQHPFLHSSSHWQRGKIARAFASKIAIAAKADSYSDNFLAPDLKSALDKRIADIKANFREPPKKGHLKKAGSLKRPQSSRGPRSKSRKGHGRKGRGRKSGRGKQRR